MNPEDQVQETDVRCNMCGQSCQCYPSPSSEFCFATLDVSTALGVYGSEFDDVYSVEAPVRFCDTCTIKLLASLQIIPGIECTSGAVMPTVEGKLPLTPEAQKVVDDCNEMHRQVEAYAREELERRRKEKENS